MSRSKEKLLLESEGDESPSFSWGVRKGVIHLYESFTLDDVEYSLYDTVFLRRHDQLDIGKLVKIMETENHERKAEVVWFFRPEEIVNHLGDVKPLEREIFLACGEGKGLYNTVSLEAILGKCDVVCISKDQRNPQPTVKEMTMADYLFQWPFDVGMQKLLNEFPSSIAGIKVDHFLNRRSFTTPNVGSEPKVHLKARNEKGFDVPDSTPSGRQINSSIKDQPHTGSNVKISQHFPSVSPSDIGPTKKRKLLSSSGDRSDDALLNHPTRASGEEKHVKASCRENIDLPTRRNDGALAKPPTRALGEEKHVKASCRENTDLPTRKSLISKRSEFIENGPVIKQHKYTEVTRRPGMDAGKWLKLEVWEEERLNEANEKGTLIVLENLNPSFAASEVQDIVWHVFQETVKAKMVQITDFSCQHSGQALVMFKTKEAADRVISELISSCLVLGDGRPIVGRRRFLKKVGAANRFFGHYTVDRHRTHRQREDMKNAVSTSHFSQGNTVEFEMGVQWRELQEKSRLWWTALQEQQGKEIQALMKQMKTNHPE